MKSESASYKAAGVDIVAGYKAVELMKKHVARTKTEGCVDDIGGFGGCFGLNVAGMQEPVLVSGTDVSKRETLIAANHTVEEICEIIGADSLGYLPLEACDKIAAGSKCKFCKGCFTGEYPIAPPARKHINKYDQPLTIEKK